MLQMEEVLPTVLCSTLLVPRARHSLTPGIVVAYEMQEQWNP